MSNDKYSLGYAICSSIQENKERIEKLEKQNKRLKAKLEEKSKIINEAIAYIKDKGCYEADTKLFCVDLDIYELLKLLKILESGKNELR